MFSKAVVLCGLSIAFPMCIGTSLVIGTVVTYIVQSTGNVNLLFPGVAMAFLAVLNVSYSYKLKADREEKEKMKQNQEYQEIIK